MTEKIILEDIMLDSEPVGLAEELLPVGSPLTTVVSSEEAAEVGATVYFGVELPVGEIGEVQGQVASCVAGDDGLFTITIEVLAVDSRFPELLGESLRGEGGTIDRDEGEPLWGLGVKQTNGAMASLVNCPAGLLTGEQLTKLAELTVKGHGVAKLTHAQRMVLLLRPEQIAAVREELGTVGLRIGVLHTGIRNIRGCCGALCQFAQNTDGLGLALEIDHALYGRPMKFDIKIAVSDCLRNCMESFCVDIGLIAHDGRYDLYVGGVASSVHLRGLKLTGGVPAAEVTALIARILDWYDRQAKKGERLYKTLERLGAEARPLADPAPFAEAAALFSSLGMEEMIASTLRRYHAKGAGTALMRAELGLGL